MSPEMVREAAIKKHLSGDIISAEKGYKEFIHKGINDPDVLSNYALICQDTDRIGKALSLYEKCISLFPDHSFALSNLAYLYLSLGRIKEAEKTIQKAITLQPKLANSYSTLGLILKAKGELLEAENKMRLAITLKPDFVDAFLNLGLILKESGKLEEAETTTREAIKIKPNLADAYLNLGNILQDQGRLEEAEEVTRKAIFINPSIADAHMNLGAILKELGQLEEAFKFARKETYISPEKQAPFLLLNSILKESNLQSISINERRLILKRLLPRTDISHVELFSTLNSLVPQKNLKVIAKSQESCLTLKEFKELIKDEEIIHGLRLLVFHSLSWETALTKIRRDISIGAINKSIQINKSLIEFTISLAEQCFLNEYIFNKEQEEIKAVEILETNCLNERIDEFTIALISCYYPINEIIERIPSLRNYSSRETSFNKLISLQLEEPNNEKRIASSIKSFSSINDSTSKKVKLQYEENPYPRWRYTSHLNENKLTIESAVNNEIRPNRISCPQPSRPPRVLIAGCGTGQQIFDADRYQNAELTAIDLSKASIAYAQRKVLEYGMNNIRFFQMDILELSKLNERFDLIECCGVLHHMKSPEEGLASLVKVLEKNGFIKLGLYSNLARSDVIKARKVISKNNYASSHQGIRQFRKDLINGDFPEIENLHKWYDFFTTSMCRDLCFHVKEHRYSMDQINDILKENKLDFLGFVLGQEVKQQYLNEYCKDKSQTDLHNWGKFENIYPNTFRAMYQFWVSKSE
ncbi:tetratricopeptide repeat protein [Prochlorococcus sp. MIT 1307]|uniref:tetratricopeptide repeat protein n=1 Tax=Prochlorococcus sp. MIT 1307 TaxID=3096219 RepID=UPI002A755BAF|nr:tetratricopeptide repeat protein [Prochlorococcus sp. MIT 1307]